MSQPASPQTGGQGALKPFALERLYPDGGPPGIVEVRVSGFLDAHTVDVFEKSMEETIAQGYNRVIMNLGALNYISSAGIGALMVLLQQLRRRQGEMVILQPSAKVFKILDLLGFTKIFSIADSPEAARQHLA
ncbi:MAG TPA: STAS domain-containing protein [Candidatus Sumerlaeota bacterium]|nr:MAG: putative anti-sigma factor antagonist BtrV [candidate division BRC1 bacterium ADurb.BinA292]HOE96327.1 STAS domain-containing protein [Candidatus Sumerlaeota bacterium]HOR28224.1 STAS domain-containing protein [Candidatus Sumerlaeota bacterium]HPK01960.1 STAS domain-containing protein [Candidatus Sumerlaeota bacterium]